VFFTLLGIEFLLLRSNSSIMAPDYFRALTVGNCQLPSRGTLGGSFDAIPLFARTEARVMRGIVKGGISICSPKPEAFHNSAKNARCTPRRGAKPKPAPSKNLFHRERLLRNSFLSSSMSYRQSLESRDVDFNGCLGPLRTSCVLTTASERSGNRCSTSQTFI
jgi:hypothetical protein